MQMWPRPPIRNQLMHLLHHNIASRVWSYLLISAPPTPPAGLSSSTNIIINSPQIHIRTSYLQVWLVSRYITLHTRDMLSNDNTANANIPDIDIPTWLVGQRSEGMIKIVSQYYDAADASIDYEWAVAVTFASQACSLHHRLDICITGFIARDQ